MYSNDNSFQNANNKNNSNPYRRDQYKEDLYYKNTNTLNNDRFQEEGSSTLQLSSSMLLKPNFKRERFQNENPTVYRVSPYHYQYSTFLYDEKGNTRRNQTRGNTENNDNRFIKSQQYGDQSYNVEEERQFMKNNNTINNRNNNYNNNFENNYNNNFDNNNNNRYNNNNFNDNRYNNNYRSNNNYDNNNNNYGNNNYNNNFNDNDKIRENNANKSMNINNYNRRVKYLTPDNYYQKKQNFTNADFNQISRSQQIDFNNLRNHRTIDNDIDNFKEKDNDIGINPNNYYRNDLSDDISEDGHRHYSPDKNDYHGSRFGGYIYNYYLNAPMRGDKSEDWRFPPLYYYHPRYDPVRKIYKNM